MPITRRRLLGLLAGTAAFIGLPAAWFSRGRTYEGPISDHFDGFQFYDPDGVPPKSLASVARWQLDSNRQRVAWPEWAPSPYADTPPPRVTGDKVRLSFVGHASWLIQTAGLNILVDPVWSMRVSPVSWAGPKRHNDPGIAFEALPEIDIVLVSHGHYDHLDLPTLSKLAESDMPFEMPGGFHFGAGFQLDMGDLEATTPMQLAIKVPDTLAPGTKVFFFRADTLPDENGNEVNVWMQEDSGVVGADGYARTASPPYTGLTQPGLHMVGFSDPFSVGELRGRIYVTMPITGVDTTAAMAVMAMGPGGAAIGGLLAFGSQFALTMMVGVAQIKVIQIPEDGSLARVTSNQVEINPGRVASFVTTFNNTPIVGGPGGAPVLQSARLEFDPVEGPVLHLTGTRFTFANAPLHGGSRLGSQVRDLKINFIMPGNRTVTVTGADILSGSATDLKVKIPQSVTLGIAQIQVSRPQYKHTSAGWRVLPKTSATVRLDPEGSTYAFAALGGNEVAVVDRFIDQLAARITVSPSTPFPSPRSVAITPDGTRAYVTLRYASGVSVIDTQALQEVDVDGNRANGVRGQQHGAAWHHHCRTRLRMSIAGPQGHDAQRAQSRCQRRSPWPHTRPRARPAFVRQITHRQFHHHLPARQRAPARQTHPV